MKTTIGLQGYSVRDLLDADEKGTIKKLKQLGFEAYEALILPRNAQFSYPAMIWSMDNLEEKAVMVLEAGFSIPSTHIIADLENDYISADAMAAALRKIHEAAGTKYFVFSILFRTAEDAKAEGEYLRAVQSLVKSDGLQILYHNHDVEFETICVDGEELTAMDYFLRFAGDDVLLELDIGWAGYIADEVQTVQKYQDRIGVLHLKDFSATALRCGIDRDQLSDDAFTPIGFGGIRTAEIMKMAETMPNYRSLAIIDQDRSTTPILGELEMGYHFLENLS